MIEEYSITTTSNIGIYISSTTKYFIVRNCYVDASDYGIQIRYVADGSAIVINNTCNNNLYGIALEVSVSSTVTNNTCSNNNGCGIILFFSDSSIVANNTCNNNRVGIKLWYSGSAMVINNTCSNNYYGIYLASSAFCVVTYNHLQENERYGVCSSSDSDNNIFHYNTFVENNLGETSQAYDNGNNKWYDTATQEGNYWSDWSGTGNYSIDGDAGTFDLYPLDEPVEYSTDETRIFFTFTLLIVAVPLIFIKKLSRKKR